MNAAESLSAILLANRCEIPLSEAERMEFARQYNTTLDAIRTTRDHPAWSDLYYGKTPKRAREHLAKLAKDFPAAAAAAAPAVEAMLVALAQSEVERAERKAALEARRTERAQKAAKKTTLGVDLRAKGGEEASEATYLALRAGLRPIQVELTTWLRETFASEIATIRQRLAKHDGRADLAYPLIERNWRTGQRETVPGSFDSPHPLFVQVFAITHLRPAAAGALATLQPDAEETIAREAAAAAEAALAGYCAKLAGKVDREGMGAVRSVTCSTANIWDNSVLTVATEKGDQVWHTKVIWNRSVLGKQFNQWPTRRVA